jgi:hypothetical protein
MKRFLIQTINDRIKHDFAFALLEAIEYQNWFYNEIRFEASLSELEFMSYFDLTDVTPVGSLEFVGIYCDAFYYGASAPLNVPPQLRLPSFVKREVGIGDQTQIPIPAFVKSATQYKTFVDVIEKPRQIPKDTYFWSEILDIQSEWRAFVWQKKLVGLQCYLGDFTLFPDVPLIKNMIQTYTNCPPAYTIDVGVNDKIGTFVIEVHPFVSCGLYGFNDYKILPQMFIAAFEWFKAQKGHMAIHSATPKTLINSRISV